MGSMRCSHSLALWTGAWLLCAMGWWASAANATETPKSEVEACLERTLPTRSSIQEVEIETADEKGGIDRSRAKIHWKRFDNDLVSVVMRFSEPTRRAGMALLARQQAEGAPETFTYLPELRQVRRVSARNAAGSMFGTDFGYEDFAFIQGVTSGERPKQLDDQEVDGRLAYVWETRVNPEEQPAYERILYFVARDQCAPLKAEFYESGGRLRKLFEVDSESIEAHGERFIPMRTTMRDLELGTHTSVQVLKIQPDAEIPDRVFEPGELQRRGR